MDWRMQKEKLNFVRNHKYLKKYETLQIRDKWQNTFGTRPIR